MSDLIKEESIFKKAAEIYVMKKNIEYPEFYLKELSKLLGYEITIDHLKTIIENEMEVLCARDTAVSFNVMPEIGMKFKVIRCHVGTNRLPILFLDCVISNYSEEKIEFNYGLVYDKPKIELPLKSESPEPVYYDELDSWKFKL